MSQQVIQSSVTIPSRHQLGRFGECLNCTTLDFYDIFGFGSTDEVNPISFRDAFANADVCAFCRLLARAARQFTPHEVVDHRDGELVTFFFTLRHFQVTPTDLGTRFLYVKIYPPPSPLDMEELAFHLVPISETLPESLCHHLDRNQIDLGICRKWIANCDDEHIEKCRAFSSPTSSRPEIAFRLIDVVDECVVVPPPDAQYITLSYLWGRFHFLELNSRTESVLSQKGSLLVQETPVAQTIIDAMTVVKALGERYLWADQLCIIQDGTDKHLQIKSMDRIYGEALLTIVAADGGDANAGLPGVRPGTRTRNISQICEEVWPGFYIASTTDSPLDPAASAWGLRGWTFQEQLLSKRLLLFHQGGIQWQCRTEFFCEDTPAGMKVKPEQLRWLEQLSPRWTRDKAPSHSIEDQEDYDPAPLIRPAIFVEYAKAVKEYTKRHLTFSDDIINAFEGISSQLSPHIGGNFLAALPESYLDIALLWTPAVLQTRRESRDTQFPSWSWAGWVGQAKCDAASLDGREWIELTTKWYIKIGPAAPRLANGVGIGIDELSLGCNLSSNAISWMPIFESAGGHSGEVPVVELHHMQGPYLQLWTSCSFFTIVHRSWYTPDEVQISSSARTPIQAHIHCTTGNRRQLAGYLVLNGDGPDEIIEGKHEFIILSGAQVRGFDSISGNVTYSEEAQMYNVMLVEWNDTHQIAFRLGIGRIFKEAWDMSLPTIRFVTLG